MEGAGRVRYLKLHRTWQSHNIADGHRGTHSNCCGWQWDSIQSHVDSVVPLTGDILGGCGSCTPPVPPSLLLIPYKMIRFFHKFIHQEYNVLLTPLKPWAAVFLPLKESLTIVIIVSLCMMGQGSPHVVPWRQLCGMDSIQVVHQLLCDSKKEKVTKCRKLHHKSATVSEIRPACDS